MAHREGGAVVPLVLPIRGRTKGADGDNPDCSLYGRLKAYISGKDTRRAIVSFEHDMSCVLCGGSDTVPRVVSHSKYCTILDSKRRVLVS